MFRLAVMCAHVGSIATVSNAQGNTEVTSAPFVNLDVHTHMSIYRNHLFYVNEVLSFISFTVLF